MHTYNTYTLQYTYTYKVLEQSLSINRTLLLSAYLFLFLNVWSCHSRNCNILLFRKANCIPVKKIFKR